MWKFGEPIAATGEHRLTAFLMTTVNDVVRMIHTEAMPVLLTAVEEWDIWLTGFSRISYSAAMAKPVRRSAFRFRAQITWREDPGLSRILAPENRNFVVINFRGRFAST
jgi:putative SOS response-associated peptidase YedK